MNRRALALAILLPACADKQVDFAAKVAPDLQRGAVSVSVFGVYKDGRMAAEAWPAIAPRLPLEGACELAYGESLLAKNRPLATAIDDQARAEGPGEGLLSLFAPAATGDAILLVTVSGHPPKKKVDPSAAPSLTTTTGRGGRRHGKGHAGGRDPDAFEVSASLFSVREKRTVAVVAMTYTGASETEALSLFGDELRRQIPGLRCVAWKPDVTVEPDAVRAVRSE